MSLKKEISEEFAKRVKEQAEAVREHFPKRTESEKQGKPLKFPFENPFWTQLVKSPVLLPARWTYSFSLILIAPVFRGYVRVLERVRDAIDYLIPPPPNEPFHTVDAFCSKYRYCTPQHFPSFDDFLGLSFFSWQKSAYNRFQELRAEDIFRRHAQLAAHLHTLPRELHPFIHVVEYIPDVEEVLSELNEKEARLMRQLIEELQHVPLETPPVDYIRLVTTRIWFPEGVTFDESKAVKIVVRGDQIVEEPSAEKVLERELPYFSRKLQWEKDSIDQEMVDALISHAEKYKDRILLKANARVKRKRKFRRRALALLNKMFSPATVEQLDISFLRTKTTRELLQNLKPPSAKLFRFKFAVPERWVILYRYVVFMIKSTNEIWAAADWGFDTPKKKEKRRQHSEYKVLQSDTPPDYEPLKPGLVEIPKGRLQKFKERVFSSRIFRQVTQTRDKVVESENPIVQQAVDASSSVVEGASYVKEKVLGDTDISIVLSAIKESNPDFSLEDFQDDLERHFLPTFMRAFIEEASLAKTQMMCTGKALLILDHILGEQQKNDLKSEGKIMWISNVELHNASFDDEDEPRLYFTFRCQQVVCIRDSRGKIVEGGPTDLNTVVYVVEMKEAEDSYDWLISDFQIAGQLKQIV